MRFCASFLLLSILALSICAKTDDSKTLNGIKLLNFCTQAVKGLDGEPHENVSAAFCNAYVSGFTDALSEVSVQDSLIKFPDEGLSSHQTIRVVELWLRIHPETLHKDAGDLVMQILREKFPVSPRR